MGNEVRGRKMKKRLGRMTEPGAAHLSVRPPGQTRRWALSKWSIVPIIRICCRLDSACVAVEQMATTRELGASQ
jgi:hypothetical protein